MNLREVSPNGVTKLEVAAPGKEQHDALRIRRSLADMPLPAKQLNFISAVLCYTLIGLSDRDISEALNVSVDQVERAKVTDAYTTVSEYVTKSIIDEDADNVRAMFSANAKNAGRRVLSLMDSEDEKVALKASQDVLDRAGHRPADVLLVKGQLDNILRIQYIDDEAMPVIDGEIVSDN